MTFPSNHVLFFNRLTSWANKSPIYFVKIQLPDFLCNDIIIKICRLLQKDTFETCQCTLSKITNICCKYNIFLLVGIYLQAKEKYTRDSFPRTLVCYCRFNTVFIFIVNLNRYQNVLKRIPANIVSLFRKTISMPNLWPSRSVLRWMSVVRNLEIRNMVLLTTFDLLWHVFVLKFFISLICVWLRKNCIV